MATIAEIKEKLATVQSLVDREIGELHISSPYRDKREITIINYPFELKNTKRDYQLGKPLMEQEIQQIETQYKIHFPEGYRQFLHEVGDGGTGPFMGISSLQKAIARSFSKEDLALLGQPFPHTEAIGHYLQREEQFTDEDQYEDAVNSAAFVQGSIMIGFYGSTLEARLIIAGAEAGNIWIDDRGSDAGIWPLTFKQSIEFLGLDPLPYQENVPDMSAHADFLSWYSLWLDTEIDHLKEIQQGQVSHELPKITEPNMQSSSYVVAADGSIGGKVAIQQVAPKGNSGLFGGLFGRKEPEKPALKPVKIVSIDRIKKEEN